MNRSLRYYVDGGGNTWQGICVDLDIAVQGRSIEEVKDSIRVCVDMYLSAVADEPEEDQHRLHSRRSPWYVQAKLVCLAWLPFWSSRGSRRPQGFLVSAQRPAHA
ncbi:MAG: hypothetical protein OXN97_04755 [Bryobacterales bacterium]|nr:hypothetical protein [Bryobacterales bacterium]